MRRAIILDMDGTLEKGKFKFKTINSEQMMVLRPHLDELLQKLKEVKKQGVDIILCTSATNQWVSRFFKLKPEAFAIFNKLYTHDNQEEWRDFDKEQNPIEYNLRRESDLISQGKPITTFGYDSILFIDDNLLEGEILKQLFELAGTSLNKDVTFFSGFAYNGGSIPMTTMMGVQKLSAINYELATKMKKYIDFENNNPGCNLMCRVIDKFMKKDFRPGLTIEDDNYWEMFNERFLKIRDRLQDELEQLAWGVNASYGKIILSNPELLKQEAQEYMSSDKECPYSGLIERNAQYREKNRSLYGAFASFLFNKREPDR